MGFQISDVQKPLAAAVWRIVEQGNLVQLGPKAEDNFIMNAKTKEIAPMTRKGVGGWGLVGVLRLGCHAPR